MGMSPDTEIPQQMLNKAAEQMSNSSADNVTRWQREAQAGNQIHALYYIVAVVSFYMSSILLLLIKYIKFRGSDTRASYLYQRLVNKDETEGADDRNRADEQLIRAKSIPCFRRETRV